MNYNQGGFIQRASENIKNTMRKVLENKAISSNLDCIKNYDNYTFNHCLRVSVLSLLCGITLDYNQLQLEDICAGALLHDLGKTCLNEKVLSKPGKLEFMEFEHVKLHSQFGFDILQEKGFNENIANIALQHHERFDGSGYPMGFSGQHISDFAKIVAVADNFEALTADRVYRKAFPVKEAVEIIRDSTREKFDPAVLKAFFAGLGEDQTVNYKSILSRVCPALA